MGLCRKIRSTAGLHSERRPGSKPTSRPLSLACVLIALFDPSMRSWMLPIFTEAFMIAMGMEIVRNLGKKPGVGKVVVKMVSA